MIVHHLGGVSKFLFTNFDMRYRSDCFGPVTAPFFMLIQLAPSLLFKTIGLVVIGLATKFNPKKKIGNLHSCLNVMRIRSRNRVGFCLSINLTSIRRPLWSPGWPMTCQIWICQLHTGVVITFPLGGCLVSPFLSTSLHLSVIMPKMIQRWSDLHL